MLNLFGCLIQLLVDELYQYQYWYCFHVASLLWIYENLMCLIETTQLVGAGAAKRWSETISAFGLTDKIDKECFRSHRYILRHM